MSVASNNKKYRKMRGHHVARRSLSAAAGFVLTPAQRAVVSSQRELLTDLRGHLTTLEATPDDVKIVSDSLHQLDEMFMVCVVGEFNAGKSSLINALIGERCLKEGVTPTTSQVCVLRFEEDADGSGSGGVVEASTLDEVTAAASHREEDEPPPQQQQQQREADTEAAVEHDDAASHANDSEALSPPVEDGGDPTADVVATRRLPVPWLSDAVIVDTPGTNAIVEGHTQLTEEIIPRCDLVLFVTSADRPFSESERDFLQRIWQWRKKVVVVLNKVDLFESPAELAEVESFVLDNATKLLGETPQLFGVSTRRAFRSKQQQQQQRGDVATKEGTATITTVKDGDRFEALEAFLVETLSTNERVELKLRNPLGVAKRVVETFEKIAETRSGVLREDVETLSIIDDQLAMYAADMRREVELQRHGIEMVLTRMVERCDEFLETKLQLRNIPSLAWSPRGLQAEFENVVIGKTNDNLQMQVRELAEWTVSKGTQQAHDTVDFLRRRCATKIDADDMVGQIDTRFHASRGTLLHELDAATRDVVKDFDSAHEAQRVSDGVQQSIFQTAALEFGAAGVGALQIVFMIDWTAVIGASTLAVSPSSLRVCEEERERMPRGRRRVSFLSSLNRCLACFSLSLSLSRFSLSLSLSPPPLSLFSLHACRWSASTRCRIGGDDCGKTFVSTWMGYECSSGVLWMFIWRRRLTRSWSGRATRLRPTLAS